MKKLTVIIARVDCGEL